MTIIYKIPTLPILLVPSLVPAPPDRPRTMMSPASQTYGPIFIGVAFNILLYGIMVMQTYLYFTVYKRDKPWMKLFVLLLLLCDTLNSIFDIMFVYTPLVTKYGDVSALTNASWVFATDPAMTAIIALLVQLFFAWRVHVLTGNMPIVAFIVLCSVAQWCGGMGTAIAVGMIPEFTRFQKFEVIVIVWLTCSAVADTTITIALVWHLRRHKTGFSHTDDVINRMIRLTVQTGLLTALCAIIDLVLFLATPAGFHLIFNLPLSKLYTNSLMSSLNSRAGWKYGTGVGKGLVVGIEVGLDTSSNGRRHGFQQNLKGGNGKGLKNPNGLQAARESQQVYVGVESHEMSNLQGNTGKGTEQVTFQATIPKISRENSSDGDSDTIRVACQRERVLQHNIHARTGLSLL